MSKRRSGRSNKQQGFNINKQLRSERCSGLFRERTSADKYAQIVNGCCTFISDAQVLRVLILWQSDIDTQSAEVCLADAHCRSVYTLGMKEDDLGLIGLDSYTCRCPNVFMVLARWMTSRQPPNLRFTFPWTSIRIEVSYKAFNEVLLNRMCQNLATDEFDTHSYNSANQLNTICASMMKSFGDFQGGNFIY